MQLTVSYLDQILVLLVFAASLNLVMGYAGVFNAAAARSARSAATRSSG